MTKIISFTQQMVALKRYNWQVQSLDPLERELINSTSDRGIMFTGVATATFNGTRYLLTSYGGQRLTLFSLLWCDDEIDQNESILLQQVTAY